MTPEEILREVRKHGKRAQGRQEYIGHLKGLHLSYRQRCLAKCYECMTGYVDGIGDCGDPTCPLYPSMPYRRKDRRPQTSRAGSPCMRKNIGTGTRPPTPVKSHGEGGPIARPPKTTPGSVTG